MPTQPCSKPELTCSLSSKELEHRRTMMRETLIPHVVSIDTLEEGLRLVFHRTPEMQEQVETMVGLERQCCGFLIFDITTGSKDISLTIEGPPEARETLAMFASLASDK